MLEIEAKYPLPDAAPLLERLREWSARLAEDRTDADHYFNAPDRDFARTDEAFRVRRIGARNLLTYKGPKIDRDTKTRKEIEVAFASGESAAAEMLQLLGELAYRPVAVVHKHRRIYELERDGFTLHISIDDVAQVGQYAEIEIVAAESDYVRAKDVLHRVASELGLTQSERRSYLEMLLTKGH